MKSELMSQLRKTLRPELLNRLEDIVIFRSLDTKDARKIARLLLAELNERLESQDVEVSLTRALLTHIVKEGFSEEYGARPLRRVIQDKVESTVADYLLKNEKKGEIELGYQGGEVVVKD